MMKFASISAVFLAAMTAAPIAESSAILYTTTELGPDFRFLTDPGGKDYGVSTMGGLIYAFDKSPVSNINLDSFSQSQNTEYVLTLQVGNYQAGYAMGHGESPYGYFPSFMGYSSGWNSSRPDVVSDLNIKGQVVGIGSLFEGSGPSSFQQKGTFAAFSAVDEKSHGGFGGNGSVVDNLNNYLATIPGVSLTSADEIDDLGRIIARGSDGNAYLLTPVGLGAPATVPEPSPLWMLGLAGPAFGLRAIRRRGR